MRLESRLRRYSVRPSACRRPRRTPCSARWCKRRPCAFPADRKRRPVPSRHDDTDSVTLDGIRNRAEQHIDRRAVSVDFLRLEKIDGVVTAKLDDLHVPIAAGAINTRPRLMTSPSTASLTSILQRRLSLWAYIPVKPPACAALRRCPAYQPEAAAIPAT